MKKLLEITKQPRSKQTKFFKYSVATLLICLLVLPLLFATADSDSGWTSFRRDCMHSGIGKPAVTPPVRLYWKQNVGSSYTNEVIEHNDLVFVCADSLEVFESDGDFFWEFRTETPITTTAYVVDDTVIIGCSDGTVHGIDIESHKESWQIKTRGEIAQGIYGNSEYCFIANAYGDLYKLNPATGEELFKLTLDAPLSYGPTLSENELIIGDDKGNLYGINHKTGALLWKEKIAKSRIGGILLSGDNVYFGSYDNNVYCVSSSNGKKIWETRVNGWIDKTPVVVDDDKLFVKVRETLLVSFDPETGKELWSQEIQPGSSELLVCDDILYFGNNRRLSTITTGYIMLQYFEFKDEQISSISLAGNKLYLGLKVGIDNIGRVACMKPSGWVNVNPKAVIETVSTTDDSPYVEVTISNIKNDNWDRTIDVGLLTDTEWITIENPTFTLKGGEKVTVKIKINPFYPGLIGTNNTVISVIQVTKRPRHIRPDDKSSTNDNIENQHIVELPLIITVDDPIAPKLCLDTSEIDIGNVSVNSYKRVPLKLTNCGGRNLDLILTAIAYPEWLSVSQSRLTIEPGQTVSVDIGATGSKITPEAGYNCDFQGALKIETNTDEVITILCRTRCYDIPLPTTLLIRIGDPKVTVNGDLKEFNPPAYIDNDRTMVPLRLIAEAFFTRVDWNDTDKSITVRDCDKVAQFWIGKNTVRISDSDGERFEAIDTPPQITDDRTFIPIRAVSEILGGIVSWDAPTKTVGIIYNPK